MTPPQTPPSQLVTNSPNPVLEISLDQVLETEIAQALSLPTGVVFIGYSQST